MEGNCVYDIQYQNIVTLYNVILNQECMMLIIEKTVLCRGFFLATYM